MVYRNIQISVLLFVVMSKYWNVSNFYKTFGCLFIITVVVFKEIFIMIVNIYKLFNE